MEYIGISLQEYLIKNSQVDRKFIKDFIDIQRSDVTQDNYPFIIDLELIMKWLKIEQKSHVKRTLLKSYIEGIDYVLLSPRGEQKKSGKGGHNKEIILVTIKCFKKICLKTKSIMANKIIDYYLALENLVIEYQKYIISTLIKENKLLKSDLNEDIFLAGGLIYVIDLNNNCYKLGMTNNLKKRKAIYDTGTVHKNKVVFTFETEDMKTVEACVKGLLIKFAIKKRKEVYMIELREIIKAIEGCSRMLSNMFCTICEQSRITNIHSHFKEHHKNMLGKFVIFKANSNLFGGAQKILIEKEHKKVSLVTDPVYQFKYIIKEGYTTDIEDEYHAYTLLRNLNSSFIDRSIPKIFHYYVDKNDTRPVHYLSLFVSLLSCFCLCFAILLLYFLLIYPLTILVFAFPLVLF